MRTSTKSVRFRHPFSLSGLSATQPAGSYVVQTYLPASTTDSSSRRRKVTTLIEIPALRRGVAVTVAAIIDAGELEAALLLDSVRRARLHSVELA